MINQENRARVAVALSVIFAWGLLWQPGPCFADETETTLVSVFKFAGGVISAFMMHEGAQFAAGQITGTSLDWKVGTLNQPLEYDENAKNDSDGLDDGSRHVATANQREINSSRSILCEVKSIGFLVKPNQPLIWRGPMLHSADSTISK